MTAAVCCDVDPAHGGAVPGAAAWLRAFHPHVKIAVGGKTVRLASEKESEEGLRVIWRAALVNEVLLARGATRRAGVIAGLVA